MTIKEMDSATDRELDFRQSSSRRHVQPSIRFMDGDTYQGVVSDPASLHKYLYANGNPVSYVDPTGNTSLLEEEDVSAEQGKLGGILIPRVAAARSTALGVIEISHLYTRFAFAAVAFSLTAVTAYYAAEVLRSYPNLQRFGEAIRDAKLAAISEGTYTKKEVDEMPIFFVFKVGPWATPEIWDNDDKAMKGDGTLGGVRASDVLRYVPGANHVNGPAARAWAAANGILRGQGQELDEYPYASTQQGGVRPGLRVAAVDEDENELQGRLLAKFYRENAARFMKSARFLVVLVP